MHIGHARIVLLAIAILMPGVVTARACSCVLSSLKNRFRNAEAVFVGRTVTVKPSGNSEIQNYSADMITFEVIKSWKGISKEYVSIDLDIPQMIGTTCPTLFQFDPEKEYLIFAYGQDLKVNTVCSDTRPLTSSYDWTAKEISKLNSRWFRFKARVWPF